MAVVMTVLSPRAVALAFLSCRTIAFAILPSGAVALATLAYAFASMGFFHFLGSCSGRNRPNPAGEKGKGDGAGNDHQRHPENLHFENLPSIVV
jgi:hypothetical protein